MSDALENKAVEILDKSQAAIATFADNLVEMAQQYGPDVAEAALTMARIDALSSLVPALVGLIATVVYVYFFFKKMMPWVNAEHDYDINRTFTCIVSTVAMFFVGLFSLVGVLNLWLWVGVFEPKLWVAKKVLGL